MRFLPLFTLGICASAALAQPNKTPATIASPPAQAMPRPGTPREQVEKDLRALLVTLNSFGPEPENVGYEYDVPAAISGGRIGYFGLSEWRNYFVAERQKTNYRIDKIEFEALEKDSARVKIFYALLTPNNIARADGKPAGPAVLVDNQSETLDLRLEDSLVGAIKTRWRIVPPKRENLQPYRTLSLQNIAYFASQRAGVLPQLRGEISASRLKQNALGVFQFVQDYTERFSFQNEFWQSAIRPYVQNDALFLIPGSQIPYTFNDQLSDKSLADINEVARTVLFYEGEGEKPVFRYDGKAAIGFTDGHVALLTPDEAKTLIWRP